MNTEPDKARLFCSQLNLLEQRLSLLQALPFDQKEFRLQADALVADIESAQIYYTELKVSRVLQQLISSERIAIENLSQEIDYELAVIRSRISTMNTLFPEAEAIFRHKLAKLRDEGLRLKNLVRQLTVCFERYFQDGMEEAPKM